MWNLMLQEEKSGFGQVRETFCRVLQGAVTEKKGKGGVVKRDFIKFGNLMLQARVGHENPMSFILPDKITYSAAWVNRSDNKKAYLKRVQTNPETRKVETIHLPPDPRRHYLKEMVSVTGWKSVDYVQIKVSKQCTSKVTQWIAIDKIKAVETSRKEFDLNGPNRPTDFTRLFAFVAKTYGEEVGEMYKDALSERLAELQQEELAVA